jgi:DNA polymerase IV
MTRYLLSKKKFFAALDQLDDSDHQDEEHNDAQALLATPAEKAIDRLVLKNVTRSPEHILTVSANSDSRSSCDIQSKRNSPSGIPKLAATNRPPMNETMPAFKMRSPPEKKRKTNSAKIVPVDQQIFKGLIFCKFSSMSKASDFH